MQELEAYGMAKFGELRLAGNTLAVSFTDDRMAEVARGIYAWVIDRKIVRIGSSRAPLRNRTNDHAKWIERRLCGLAKISDPKKLQGQLQDALRWKTAMETCGSYAEVWGRQGTVVDSPLGPINIYLAEENFLLERHRPPFNNSHFR
jgi:hypothetical protein